MSKISNISGFPELQPEEKATEEWVLSTIRHAYRSFGFTPIETPAVELVSTLTSKGFVDKEIFLVNRAVKDGEVAKDAELALHFDLTVPFARYVAQHYSKLNFPFKRYQVQKVWRGERPQKGRFREFYQFDIDTVCQDDLPIACDSEILTAIDLALTNINFGKYKFAVNNRKILFGIYESLGLSEELQKKSLTAVDKIDKIGPDGVLKELESAGVDPKAANKIVEISKLKFNSKNFEDGLNELKVSSENFKQGLEEIKSFIELLPEQTSEKVSLELSLARGLDYYTGTIFETIALDYPEFGSIASGGRYSNLASQFINKKLPGVGASIGLSRLMELILSNKLIELKSKSPSHVMVSVFDEAERVELNKIAAELRQYGLNVEVYPKAPKLGKQIEYAEAKGINYVLFYSSEKKEIEVKNLKSKEQVKVSDLKAFAGQIANAIEAITLT